MQEYACAITATSVNYLLFWLPEPTIYGVRLAYSLISVILTGIGASLFLMADIMPLPAEGLSQAITDVTKGKIKIGNAKIIVDSSMVAASIIISLIFVQSVNSVREGTILAALLVGKVINYMMDNHSNKIVGWINKNVG